jgi:hypothetical protein
LIKKIYRLGRSNDCGQWGASQRPYDVTQLAYGGAQHLFLGNDPDIRSRRRYDEIGGIDGNTVRDVTRTLPKFHWLYIRRDGPKMCTVGP